MTGRDRIVVMVLGVLAVLAAFWILVVSPERNKADKLGAQVSTAHGAAEQRRSAARERTRGAGAVPGRVRVGREPRQSRARRRTKCRR